MRVWEFLKHAVGGGMMTFYGASKVENFVRQENIPAPERPKIIGAGIGAVGGGVLGYWIGEEIANHERTYTVHEKTVSTAIGAAGGSIAGYAIGSYLAEKLGLEKTVEENLEKKV